MRPHLPTLALALLVGCGGPATYESLCVAANNGKEMSIRGRITTASVTVNLGGGLMLFLDDPHSSKTLLVEVPVGDTPNHVEDPPAKFTGDQVRIHADDDSVHPLDTDMTITGTYKHSEMMGTTHCSLTKVTKVVAH